MFWDGERWIPETGPIARSPRPTGSSRARTWLATLPILLLVPALVFPFLVASATTYHPRVVVRGVAEPGALVTLVGSGFRPGGILQVRWDKAPTRMRLIWVNSRGGFRAGLRIPAAATPGTHLVTIGRPTMGSSAAAKTKPSKLLRQRYVLSVKLQVRGKGKGVGAAAPKPTPAVVPTPASSVAPTPAPGVVPAVAPTSAPSSAPAATSAPTVAPSPAPTATSSSSTPSATPTATPRSTPTPTPTPTTAPAPAPTPAPTTAPTTAPTPAPATACGSTLQERINAAAPGGTLDLTGCTYVRGATVNKAITIRGATIRPPAGTAALLVTASDVTLDGLHLIGPQATTYNNNEVGVEAAGTASSAVRRLTVKNCEISNFGYGGMYLRRVADLLVADNRVRDGVYAGIMVLSGAGGRVQGNTVQRIGVVGAAANSNNAYGIALSQQNPANDPPTTDFVVSGNTVEDVPTWHAFDTHGGQRIVWTGNVARRSRSGIFITSGGGRSLDNDVNGNTFYAPTGADHYAITSVYSTGGYVRNNTIVGWPAGHEILTTSGGDPSATAVGLTISGNTITR